MYSGWSVVTLVCHCQVCTVFTPESNNLSLTHDYIFALVPVSARISSDKLLLRMTSWLRHETSEEESGNLGGKDLSDFSSTMQKVK